MHTVLATKVVKDTVPKGYSKHADYSTLAKSRKVNSRNTCKTRRLDYWVADTLNGPGPSNMVWALKWAGPQKKIGPI